MVYIGETTSSNDVYDIEPKTLYKGKIYWVEYVEYEAISLKKHFIYKDVENIDYIGCNNNGTDVSNDFIALSEWREQQMKSILDD